MTTSVKNIVMVANRFRFSCRPKDLDDLGFVMDTNYRTLVTVLHPNQSPSMDTLWRSLISLSTWAA